MRGMPVSFALATGTMGTLLVCCAASAVLELSQSGPLHADFSHSVDCLGRCGPICAGVGWPVGQNRSCTGCTDPRAMNEDGSCPAGFETNLQGFIFRAAAAAQSKAACDSSACMVQANATVHVSPGSDHGISVRYAQPTSGDLYDLGVATFKGDRIPGGSSVVGPGIIQCSNESGHLVVEHGTLLKNVYVEGCSDTCGVHVQLPHVANSLVTTLDNLVRRGTLHTCIAMVTAKHRERAFSGHGTVKVFGEPVPPAAGVDTAAGANARWDLVLASVDGTVEATAEHRILLYERSGGETKVENGGAAGMVYNLTAEMALFSPEYLIEFYNGGVLHRGPKVPKWMGEGIWWLAGVLLIEIGVHWAVVVPLPPSE
jgi:hypothetical protein